MKKKLIRILLFGFSLFILSKAFIAVNAVQILSAIKDQHKNEFLLTYDWISSSLDGTISIEGLELTPYSMKKTFSIKQLSLHYGSYYSLLTQLPSLKEGSIGSMEKVSIPSIQSELKGRSFKELLAEKSGESWFTPLNIYACGDRKHLSFEDYQLMGVKSWDAEVSIELSQNTLGHDLLSITIDQNELGRIKLKSEMPMHSIDKLLKQKQVADLVLFSLWIEHQDAGFFRRLNILCNSDGADKRSIFSANAAYAWKNKMFSHGLLVSDNLVELYARYFMQGGSLQIKAKKQNGFHVNKAKGLINKDLIKYFDMTLNLNDQELKNAKLYLDGSIIYPPIKQAVQEPLPLVEKIKFEPGYKIIELTLVDQYIGRKIRVNMLDGKKYEGLLGSLTEYNLELVQNSHGGVVNYPLMLNEINTFEVWLNQAQ